MVWITILCERCKKEIMTPTIEYSNSIKNLSWCSSECQQAYYDTFDKCDQCHCLILDKTFKININRKHYCGLYCAQYENMMKSYDRS